MKRRDFLKSTAAVAGAVTAPAIFSSAKAQARNETLLIVSESGPNNIDIHGVGTNVPGYEVSWNCYDRLISHEMKTGPNGQPYYDKDKFKPELAEDMNIGDMSATFKLKKKATFHDGTPITAQGRQMVARPRRQRRRLPDLPDGRRFADQERAVRGGRRPHRPRRLPASKDRLTIPDLAVDRALRCYNSGLVQEERHREGSVGASNTPSRTPPAAAPISVASWVAGTEVILERNDATGSAARCRRFARRLSGAWCRRPATAARCWNAATPTSPTSCRTRISSSSSRPASSTSCRRRSPTACQYHRHEREEPAVRQSEGAPGGGLCAAVSEDHGRRAVRPRQADVRRKRSAATEVAWPQPHKYNTDIAKAKALLAEAGYPERLRNHALVRLRLR